MTFEKVLKTVRDVGGATRWRLSFGYKPLILRRCFVDFEIKIHSRQLYPANAGQLVREHPHATGRASQNTPSQADGFRKINDPWTGSCRASDPTAQNGVGLLLFADRAKVDVALHDPVAGYDEGLSAIVARGPECDICVIFCRRKSAAETAADNHIVIPVQ